MNWLDVFGMPWFVFILVKATILLMFLIAIDKRKESQ